MELQHNPGHTVHQTRRKSTLRVVTEDEGLHTIKLPRGSIPEENQSEEVTESMRSRTSSTKSREMRWQSVRKRVAEKRLSTNLEMKNVRRLARQSTLIPARSQFQEIPIRKQNVSIPLARSTSFPIIKERIPEKKRTLSCDDLPKLETESQEDSFGGKKEDLLLPQFSSATFNVIEEESPEETNLLQADICEDDNMVEFAEQEDGTSVRQETKLSRGKPFERATDIFNKYYRDTEKSHRFLLL